MRATIMQRPAHHELWLLEHPPCYTQGQAGKEEHILYKNNIPIVQTDRGGQVTYHGPGQLMIYTLFNLRQMNIGIRSMVTQLENAVIELLNAYNIRASADKSAPGVYVDKKKIASIGLRVRHGYCYHGMALNIKMDLSPFSAINPCGYQGLAMTQIHDLLPQLSRLEIQHFLIDFFQRSFGFEAMKSTSLEAPQSV